MDLICQVQDRNHGKIFKHDTEPLGSVKCREFKELKTY